MTDTLLFNSKINLEKKSFAFVRGSSLLFSGEQNVNAWNPVLKGLAAVVVFVLGGLILTFALMFVGIGPQWGFIIGFVSSSLGCLYILIKKPRHREIILRTPDNLKYLTLKPSQDWGFFDYSFDCFDSTNNLIFKLYPGAWSMLKARPLLCIDSVTDRNIVSVSNPSDIWTPSFFQSVMMDGVGQKIADIRWTSNYPLLTNRDFSIAFSKNDASIPDCAILAILLYLDAILLRNYSRLIPIGN